MPPGAKPWCGGSKGCRIAPFGPSGAEVQETDPGLFFEKPG